MVVLGNFKNGTKIKRPFVEACVLNGLRHHLMDPARTELFCREYARHLNEARMQRSAAKEGARSGDLSPGIASRWE